MYAPVGGGIEPELRLVAPSFHSLGARPDVWEQAFLVKKGDNYGWSVTEGSHPFYLTRKQAPVPLTKPTVEHHHSEARSLTGGLVYAGVNGAPTVQGNQPKIKPAPRVGAVFSFDEKTSSRRRLPVRSTRHPPARCLRVLPRSSRFSSA